MERRRLNQQPAFCFLWLSVLYFYSMEFSNAAIDVASLPRAEEIDLRRIEPSYWKVLQLSWLISTLILFTAGAAAIFFVKKIQSAPFIAVIAGVLILWAASRYWLLQRSFAIKAYAIREKDVLYRTGYIIRRLHACPFNRIQHCSVHSGVLERQYGLASISLFTAGSEGSDLRIPGLKEETAASIREFIMQKIKTDEQPAD
jgi:uncharacterized protein